MRLTRTRKRLAPVNLNVMFKKYLSHIAVAITFLIIGHVVGVFSALYYKFDNEIREVKRFHVSSLMAFTFVPLRSLEEGKDKEAKIVLTKELTAGIKLIKEYYDPDDEKSRKGILEIVNKITKWVNEQEDPNARFRELKDSLDEFNKKHNKAVKNAR